MVIDMTDDDYSAEELERARRKALVDEARSRVEQMKDIEKRKHEAERLPGDELARRLIPAAPDDAIAKWAQDSDRRTAARERFRAELHTRSGADGLVYKRHDNAVDATRGAADWSAWNTWCDARIAEALDREREGLAEGFGEGIAKLLADEREATSRAIRDQIRDLKIEIAKLGSESAALREALAADRGKVVEMPSPLSRRVN